MLKNFVISLAFLLTLAISASILKVGAMENESKPADADNFYAGDKLIMTPVTFPNQYKMEMSGDLFLPKDMDKNKKYPAIIVGHPMEAAREQSAVLYAQKMAEAGFVTLAMDLA